MHEKSLINDFLKLEIEFLVFSHKPKKNVFFFK